MTSKRIRKSQIIVVALILLLTSLLAATLSAEWAVADNQVGFEIEGNTALDHGLAYDWESAIPPASLFKDPNSKAQTDSTTFRPDGKFDDPAGWSIVPGKVGPGQDELTNVMAWAILPGDLGAGQPEHTWLIMGMERTKKEGTFFLDFEFNRLAWDGLTGGPRRSDGDLVVGFELKGNPTDKQKDLSLILLQYGPGPAPAKCQTTWGGGSMPESVLAGSDPCPAYGDSGFYYRFMGEGVMLSSSGFGEATMNETPFAAPPWGSTDAGGSPRDMIGPFQFAEAAIDLSNFDIEPVCASFSSVHAKSRSSLEPNSDLKDLAGMGSFPVECSLEGYKFLDVDGDGEWDRPGESGLAGWTINLSDGRSTATDAGGHYRFDDLLDGEYTVDEVCPVGWVQTAPGATDFDTCGSQKHRAVAVNIDNRQVTGLNFGNGRPELKITRSCSPPVVFAGDYVTVTTTVANAGNVNLRDIEVSSDRAGQLGTLDRLEPGESKTYTNKIRTENAGPMSCHAQASGHYGLAIVTDTADTSCEVYSIPPITNVETDPTFTRQYLWSIDKEVSKTEVSLLLAQTERMTYTVEVGLQEPAFEDLEFKIGGSVTISNRAPIAATFRAVAVRLSDGQALDLRNLLIVPGGESVTINFGPVPVDDGEPLHVEAVADFIHNHKGITVVTNTANAEFGPTPADEIDEEVTVCDDGITSLTGDLNDGSAGSPLSTKLVHLNYLPLIIGGKGKPCTHLGTVHYSEAPKVFTYSETIGPFIDDCEAVLINVARITTNDTKAVRTDSTRVSAEMMCTVTVAYEDNYMPKTPGQKTCNDWDYNDVIFDVFVEPEIKVGQLDSMVIRIHQEEGTGKIQAVYHHSFRLEPDFAPVCTGKYWVTRIDGTTTTARNFPDSEAIELISDSHLVPDNSFASLRIEFDSCPLAESLEPEVQAYDPNANPHGERLFLKPWILVDIGRGLKKCPVPAGENPFPIPSAYDRDNYQSEPSMLVVPVDWHDWPAAEEQIWDHYPDTVHDQANSVDRDRLGPIFDERWWEGRTDCPGGDV
jgi:hypothetical protein